MEAIGSGNQKVLMSNRQYAALRIFTDHPDDPLPLDAAINIDQRSLGSLYHRGWIKYTRDGLLITRAGLEAKYRFENTIVMRDTPSKAFSHYMHNVNTLMNFTVHYRRAKAVKKQQSQLKERFKHDGSTTGTSAHP
jgi:hypothetical protein